MRGRGGGVVDRERVREGERKRGRRGKGCERDSREREEERGRRG